MYKNLYIYFRYLKFCFNYYNLVLVRSERIYQNNFFKNNVNVKKTFNQNFMLEVHWSFLNRKTSYNLGFSSTFFNFKTNFFFFNFLEDYFYLQKKNSIVSNFSISSSDRKNSRKLWKYKFVSVVLNFSDWSIFFKNSVKKSKILFLFGSSHPLQSINFQSLKQYDIDIYNKNDIDFRVDIEDNGAMNQNKSILLSEIFFFNNGYDHDSNVDNKVFSFFFFKIFSKSNFFSANRHLFKYPTVFSFLFFVNYPFFFKNNFFVLSSTLNLNVSSNFFFDKSCLDGVHSMSHFDLFFLRFMCACFACSNYIFSYLNFFVNASMLFPYGIAEKKKKRYFKKLMEKKPNKKVVEF